MTDKAVSVYTVARLMASDVDLCRVFDLTPEALEAYRPQIDRARAEAMVEMRYMRAVKTARGKAKSG